MYDMPIHPAIVHLPLGIAFITPLVAGAVVAGVYTGKLPRLAWAAPLLMQLVVFGAAIAALRTGEGEEERVEEAGVPESAIHEHEERAEAFVWTSGLLLLGFAAAALVPKPQVSAGIGAVGALGAIGLAGLGVAVGEAGGELVYVHGAANAYGGGAVPGGGEAREAGDEDED